jgi:YHS domain-containing protein
MFRLLLFVLIALILPAVLRAVMAILGKATQSAASPQSTTRPPGRTAKPAEPERVGELKKDPVCGTFISTSTAFQKALSGETYYFCSVACRDAFKG